MRLQPTLGQPRFDRIYLIDICTVELSVFGRPIVQAWNHNVHVWLKKQVHLRIKDHKLLGPLCMYVTFLFSAFWHGFYPIYYGAFLFYSVGTQNCNLVHKVFVKYTGLQRPFFHLLC